jgi:hypothetical protein
LPRKSDNSRFHSELNQTIQERQQGLFPKVRATELVLGSIGTSPFLKPDFRGSTY